MATHSSSSIIIILLVFAIAAIALPLMTPYSETIVTKLTFFIHVRVTGPDQTLHKVAQTDISSTSSSLFGHVFVADDPFTVGPQPDSQTLGRAQGIVCFADLHEMGPHVSVSFVFTSGEYKGSTLSMLGRNNMSQEHRQMPIVGGTGAFEMARGIATTTNHSQHPHIGYFVFRYNIVVTHAKQMYAFL